MTLNIWGIVFKQQLFLNTTPYWINLSVINDWKIFSEFVCRERMDVPFMKSVERVIVTRLLVKPFSLLLNHIEQCDWLRKHNLSPGHPPCPPHLDHLPLKHCHLSKHSCSSATTGEVVINRVKSYESHPCDSVQGFFPPVFGCY